MINRRDLLAATAGAAVVAALPVAAMAQDGEASRLNTLLDELFARALRRGPELTTAMGLDKGDLAWTRSALSDNSLAAFAQNKDLITSDLKRLRQIDRSALKGMDAVNYDTVEFDLAGEDEANRKFAFGGLGAGAPYVLSQLTGAYQSVPDFMDNQHPIEGKADADAYLARMEAFGRIMDQEAEVARHDAALGVVPPDFVIDKALVQMRAFRDQPADRSPLVASLERRAKEKGVPGDWAGQASKLFDETVRPAMERQIALLEGWRPAAVHDAGVWRLKDGGDYYAASLKQYTTTTISPAEVHQLGLDQVASLQAQADRIMKANGLTKGTVGERLHAMFEDPKYRYPNTDEGKEKLIADVNDDVKVVQARLPAWFGTLPKASVLVKRVPKAIEAGAPAGYYQDPPLDGSRPGLYWINLRDTAEVPRWLMPTFTYHEAMPGHHLQGTLAREIKGLPLYRQLTDNSAYREGWALYAEQLAVEMGLYDKDPMGHVGQLHDALLRAVRLVLDSGLHDKRWSREQAVKYFCGVLGDPESAGVGEVERYCVWPGQACSYMVGKLTLLRLRERAKTALGKRFDIRAFHDTVLLSGVMPLAVLERRVDDMIAAAKA